MTWSRLLIYETSTFVLKLLESGQVLLSDVVKKKITIVQAWQDESSDSVSTSFKVYEPADPIDVTNLPVYWLAQAGDVFDIDIWRSNTTPKLRTSVDGKMVAVPSRGRLRCWSLFSWWGEHAMKNSVLSGFNLSLFWIIQLLISFTHWASLNVAQAASPGTFGSTVIY